MFEWASLKAFLSQPWEPGPRSSAVDAHEMGLILEMRNRSQKWILTTLRLTWVFEASGLQKEISHTVGLQLIRVQMWRADLPFNDGLLSWRIRSGCTVVTKPSNISFWLALSSSFLKPSSCLFLPYWFSQQTLLWIYFGLGMALEDAVSYEDWRGSLFREETWVGFLVVIPRVSVSNRRTLWDKIHVWDSSDLNYLMWTLGFFWVEIPHLKS